MNTRSILFSTLMLALAPGLGAEGGSIPSIDDPLVPETDIEVARQVIAPNDNLAVYRAEPFECALMRLGHRQGWRDIEWRTDIDAALADAQRLDRPIAVIMMLEEYGQETAGFN